MSNDQINPDSPICASGKRGYETEHKARQHLKRIQYARGMKGDKPRKGSGRVERNVYLCKTCDWWHLSQTNGIPGARARRRKS